LDIPLEPAFPGPARFREYFRSFGNANSFFCAGRSLFFDYIYGEQIIESNAMDKRSKNTEKKNTSKKKSVLAKMNDDSKPDKGTKK
jgi:hypothetical protein